MLYAVVITGFTTMLKVPLPVPVAVAPLLSVSVQLPVAFTVPVMVADPPLLQILVLLLVITAVGLPFTITDVVLLLQPVADWVNVKLTVPADTPVTTPALVTVAMALLLLVHVPPEAGERFMVDPTHTDVPALTAGLGFTSTFAVFTTEAEPQALVAVREYTPASAFDILVIDGFCSEEVNPFGPVHDHDDAPDALPVKLSVPPSQTGLGFADADTRVGILLIVMAGEVNTILPGPTPPPLLANQETPS